jgi:hypothetical protein
MENKQLPRFNTRWRAPRTRTSTAYTYRPINSNAKTTIATPAERAASPRIKLSQCGASATVIPPYWPDKMWFQQLHHLAAETIHCSPADNLIFPDRLGSREGVGRPCWTIVAFRLLRRRGCTPAAALKDTPSALQLAA